MADKTMKKIMVIGAGAYQVPLIKRIVQRGYQAICVDKNPSAPGFEFATDYRVIDVMDRESCLSYAEEAEIDAVMTYGATLTLPTVAYVAEKMGLPGLNSDTAEISKNKYLIKKRLYENGCNVEENFFALRSMDEAKKLSFDIPCVIKPSDGSGSKGVSIVRRTEDIEMAVSFALDNARYGEIYVEPYIDGEEYSVETFACDGEIYVYVIVKTTFVKNEYGEVEYGHRTPTGLSEEKESLIAEEVSRAVKALGITIGSANFDVILSNKDGKPYIIDCGIRIGQNLIASHFVPLSRGVSVIDNTIDLFLGKKVDAAPKFKKCVATRLLIYSPGVIEEIKPTNELMGKNGIVDIVLSKKVGDIQKEYQVKSDTCGWVVTMGNNPDEAESNAKNAKLMLKKFIIIRPFE